MNHVWQCDSDLGVWEGARGARTHKPAPCPNWSAACVCRSADRGLHLCLSHTRRSRLLGPGTSSSPGARGSFTIIKFNPLLFQMEQLRPREVKQFVAGHTELVTDNGLKLTALPGFLLLFSSIPSLLPFPPTLFQLTFPKCPRP